MNGFLVANQRYTVNTLQATPKLEDFPALGGLAAAEKRASGTAGPSSSQALSTQASAAGPAADAAAAATGVSDALKAANKARAFRPTQYPVSACLSSHSVFVPVQQQGAYSSVAAITKDANTY